MKIFLILLTCVIFQSASALDFPSQKDIEEHMKKEQMHTEASKKIFQSDNESDQKEGLNYLLKESKEGSAYSTGKIGWAYQMGLGVSKDIDKAKLLYISAAVSGMTYWQYLLAHAYEQGYLGFEKSEQKYQYWLNFQPKVHIAKYECWVANYYEMGIFPENNTIYKNNQKSCNESTRPDSRSQ
jgi:hypothetical protein